MTARVTAQSGVFAGILVGSDELGGAVEYTIGGVTSGSMTADEFGQLYDNIIPDGSLALGKITVTNVISDPTNAAQIALAASVVAITPFGPDAIKFKRTATQYYTPGPGCLVYVTKINDISMKRKGAPETIGYEFNITGAPMVLHPALASIAITGGNSGAVGAVKQLTATGTYSSGPTADITSQVLWASSDETKAVITKGGKVVGISAGTPNITATLLGIVGTEVYTVS